MADSGNESGGHNNVNASREQDHFLPIANVSRIMKKALPANAKISKDAKEMVQECVSEFISFVTGEASDKCLKEKRKTINGDDLLWSMTTLGFEDYIEPLKLYLQKFRDIEGDKGGSSCSQSQKDGSGGNGGNGGNGSFSGGVAGGNESFSGGVAGGNGSFAGGAAPMYGSSGMMMMDRQMYVNTPPSSYHHPQYPH